MEAGFVVIGFVVAALFIGFMAVVTVPQGMHYTVERFGKYTATLTPGLGFIVPFFDRVGARINMMEQVVDVPTQEIITKDNAMVAVDGVLFFQILDAAKSAYEVNNLDNATINLTMDQHPYRDGIHGSRRTVVQARRDQCAPAEYCR